MAGYNFSKRISLLRRKSDEANSGRWGLVRSVVVATIAFSLLTIFFFPSRTYVSSNTEEQEDTWRQELSGQFEERLLWLEESPLAIFPGTAEIYYNFGQGIERYFDTAYPTESEQEISLLTSAGIWLSRLTSASILRLGFVVIGFWPLWLLSTLLGYYLLRKRFSANSSKSILGVCHKGDGPFYSGIYGPLRPNNSTSATDFSCPGLACPPMVEKKIALSDKISRLLQRYGAFNDTNLDLIRIILNHGDFPSYLAEENTGEEESENPSLGLEEKEIPDDIKISASGFVSNERGTLKNNTLKGLAGVLEARKEIGVYVGSLEDKNIKSGALNKNFGAHVANLEKLTTSTSPLAKLLISSLTPNRLWALGHLPPQLIASAYLATEAGKSLVYKRHSNTFVRISNYPHLQARAVIQSLPSYHEEYSGDERMTLRQAVICSRRHGDFGQAFLPDRMSLESRAIRDWLEILYAESEKRSDLAHIVELDGHIDEIHVNWRRSLFNLMLKDKKQREADTTGSPVDYDHKKGLVFKSVVLIPVRKVLTLALGGIHPQRLKRVSLLLQLTRKFQTKLSISARLPGFQRQALEADIGDEPDDEILSNLAKSKDGSSLLISWRIVRRMLTRYNWLSTRVGDDAVPIGGLVQCLLSKEEGTGRISTAGIEGIAPLRQRRFAELFGKTWEATYYSNAPIPEDIEIYVEHDEFIEKKRKSNLASKIETSDQEGKVTDTNSDRIEEHGNRSVKSGLSPV